VSCAKTAEPIKMPFGTQTRVGLRNHVLDEDALWHNLANMIEPSMCSSNAALCQITLTTCCCSEVIWWLAGANYMMW